MSEKKRVSGLSMSTSNLIMSIIALIIAIILIVSVFQLAATYHDVVQHTDEYMELRPEIEELARASDYLTEEVRLFVITENDEHISHYLHEANVDQRRENSLSKIANVLEGSLAYQNLKKAFDEYGKRMKNYSDEGKMRIDTKMATISIFAKSGKKFNSGNNFYGS